MFRFVPFLQGMHEHKHMTTASNYMKTHNYVTISEAARKLQCSRKTVYNMLEKGRLNSEERLGRTMIRAWEINQLLYANDPLPTYEQASWKFHMIAGDEHQTMWKVTCKEAKTFAHILIDRDVKRSYWLTRDRDIDAQNDLFRELKQEIGWEEIVITLVQISHVLWGNQLAESA